MRSVFAASRNSWWAQALQNRLVALVLAMVVIVPLIASPADNRLAGTAALTVNTFAVLLAFTLLWRAKWDLSRERVSTFLRTGANLPVLLFMGLATVSCVLFSNGNLGYAVQETMKVAAGVMLYFVVAYQFRQSKHLSMLVDTLLFLAAIMSLSAMAQYALNAAARGTAFYGNQQPLGSLLMLLLPIVAVVALTEKDAKRQLAAQVISVMTLGGLMLAHTRSAWIGAAAGLAVLAMLAFSTAKKAQPSRSVNLAAQKHKFVLPAMIAIVALGFVFAMVNENGQIGQRVATLPAATQDISLQHRMNNFWNGAIAMFQASPLTGWGIGQYPLYQHLYTGEGVAIAETGVRGSLAEQAHNFFLQTAVELGLPGLLLFIGILGSFLYAAVKRVHTMDAGIRRSLLMGSIAAVVAFGIDALSSPSWQYGQISMFLWLTLGAGVSCLRPRVKHEVEEEKALMVRPKVVRPMAMVAAALVMALVVLPSATFTAQAQSYNDDDDENTIVIVGIIGALAYLIFNANANRPNVDRPGPPVRIIPAPNPPAVVPPPR